LGRFCDFKCSRTIARIADGVRPAATEVKPFIRSYFNTDPGQVNLEDLSFWETCSAAVLRPAAPSTRRTRPLVSRANPPRVFSSERGDELWLAPFVTNQWLKDGQKVAVRTCPDAIRQGELHDHLERCQGRNRRRACNCPTMHGQQSRSRCVHPEGKPMQSVTVQGKLSGFRSAEGTITLPPAVETNRLWQVLANHL